MQKAFIFDMDGVIIDTERTWAKQEKAFQKQIFGEEIAGKIGPTIGMSLSVIYDLAVGYGFTQSKEAFFAQSHEKAKEIYSVASLADGLLDLLSFLKKSDFSIGLVSASPALWIDLALAKENIRTHFDYILSLEAREDLQHKPHPDGYLEAMRVLQAQPATTIILEDSNRGIEAAKTSGAYTIGFTQLLTEGYAQTGADVYADSMEEVLNIVEFKIPSPIRRRLG